MTVVARDIGFGFPAQLNPRHIAQPDHRAVRIGPQQDLPKLLGRLQPRLHVDDRIEPLAFNGRQAADLTGRDLGVLRRHRAGHIAYGDLQIGHLNRVEPDPHGVLGAEELGVADACDAAEGVGDLGGDVVAQIVLVVAPVHRFQRHDQREIPG
jgi:hypothetical protein